jgi:hypothetical protein
MIMKKFLSLFAVALVTLGFASPSLAGPSRALVQELGSVIGADEINVDLDWVGRPLNVTAAGDTTVGAGNATIGGILLSSANIGLTQNLELRIGRLPGLRSYVSLPVGSSSNYGLTLKAGGLVPGLAFWVGYGSSSFKDINAGDTAGDVSGSSTRLGVAYTWAGPLILNGTLGYGTDSSSTAGVTGSDTKTVEVEAAALYPLKANLLVGLELLYASIDAPHGQGGTTDYKLTLFVPALGARATAGNWTIDAVVALLGSTVKVDTTPTATLDTATATVIGVPNLRINYKF